MSLNDSTTIRVFRVDAAEFSKLCRLAGKTSPEIFHVILVKNLDGETVARIERKIGEK